MKFFILRPNTVNTVRIYNDSLRARTRDVFNTDPVHLFPAPRRFQNRRSVCMSCEQNKSIPNIRKRKPIENKTDMHYLRLYIIRMRVIVIRPPRTFTAVVFHCCKHEKIQYGRLVRYLLAYCLSLITSGFTFSSTRIQHTGGRGRRHGFS